jgi:hypothetical protein
VTDFLPSMRRGTAQLQRWFDNPANRRRVLDDTAAGFHGIATAVGAVASAFGRLRQFDRWTLGVQEGLSHLEVPASVPFSGSSLLFGRFAGGHRLVGAVGGGGDFGGSSPRPDDRAVGPRRGSPAAGAAAPGSGMRRPGQGQPRSSTGIPWLDYLLAQAEATPGSADDERQLRRAISVIRGRLSRAKSLAARTELQRALNQYADQLAQLEAQDQAEAQAKIDAAREKARSRRERLAEQRRRRQERLATQHRAAEQRRENAVERTVAGFDRRLALTEATPDNDDNLRILHDEMRFLRSQIKNTRLAQSFRDKLEGDYTALIRRENALRRAKKQPKIDTAGREQQAFIGELSGILGQFSSNVAGAAGSAPTGAVNHITINNPTPKSNFAMLREARLAAAHVF